MPDDYSLETLHPSHHPFLGNASSQSTTAPDRHVSPEAPPVLDLRGYGLMERLGGGGMGDVYRAGDPALGRDLAVKVMKAGLQGWTVAEQRFLREARVTGSLQHPGIVPVYNLGRLADGRLHYTMRLVHGQTLSDILREEAGKPERLPALLAIFEKVCQAVAYAHSKRVLHRDLKPANIMVGRFGEVQVMDWGLAKVLGAGECGCVGVSDEAEEAGTRIHTEFGDTPPEQTLMGQGMGTPAYMPPEQAWGEWNAVDERADVFSLGAILCEILTGRTPYSGASNQETLQKAQRGDCTETLARLDDCCADTALVGLCRDCLSSSREHRPRDAEQVAQRVAAYQAEVQERLRSAELERTAAVAKAGAERRRRRWMLAAVLFLLFGAAVSSWQAVRASNAERLAQQNEGQALTAADAERRAKQLAENRLGQIEKANLVLASIFRDLDPRAEVKGGPDLRQQLSKHLQQAAAQLDETTVGDALALGRLQTTLARSLTSLGHAPLAIELLKKAVPALEANLGLDNSETLTSRHYLAIALWSAGRFAEAIPLHEQILAQREAKLGPDHRDTLSSLNGLALAYRSAGRTAEALHLHEEGLKRREAKFGTDSPATFICRSNLAGSYRIAGRTADAIRLLEQNLKQQEARIGADHPDTLLTRNSLALAYNSAGRTGEAIRLHEQILKQREAKLGLDHPHTLNSRNNLANAYRSARRLADAIHLHEQTAQQMEAKLGPDHPSTLLSRNNLARAYRDAGRTTEAVRFFEQTLSQREAKLGTDHPATLKTRHTLANAYLSVGRTEDAILLHEQNLQLRKAKLGSNHLDSLLSMARLGTAYREAGRLNEAISLLETALERCRRLSGELPAVLMGVPISLARCYSRAGQPDKAESIYRDALERTQRQFGPEDPRTAGVLIQLGKHLLKQKRFTDAELPLRQCLTIRQKKQPDAWNTFSARSVLGGALLGQKKYAEAEPLLLEGYEGMKQRQDKILPASKNCLSDALERVVRLYEATKQKDKAADWRKKLEEAKAATKKAKP